MMRNKWNGMIFGAALLIQLGIWLSSQKLFYGAYWVTPFLLLCLIAQIVAVVGWMQKKAPTQWQKRIQVTALGLSVALSIGLAPRYTMQSAIEKVRQESDMAENVYTLQADPQTPVVSKQNSSSYDLNPLLYCIRATGQSLTYWAYFDPATGEYRLQTVMDADASAPA